MIKKEKHLLFYFQISKVHETRLTRITKFMRTTGFTDVPSASIVHFSVPKCTRSGQNSGANTLVKQEQEEI